MIEIIDSGSFSKEKELVEKYYQNTQMDFQFILGNPHKLILNKHPFSLNFNTPGYQRLISNQHPLLTAIGKKPSTILDAFGGLGKDGFILSHQHHHVTTTEINPILYLLLSQALENYPHTNIHWEIRHQDATHAINSNYDIIYIDPMFEQDSTSKPKLAMQIIQEITLAQTFNHWKQAYNAANKKLIIKRHQSANYIEDLPAPSTQVKGKRNTRYDIYLK